MKADSKNVVASAVNTRKNEKYIMPDVRLTLEQYMKILKSIYVGSEKGLVSTNLNKIASLAGMHESLVKNAIEFFSSINALALRENEMYPSKSIISMYSSNDTDKERFTEKYNTFLKTTWFGDHIIKLMKIHHHISREKLCTYLATYAHVNKYQQQSLELLIDMCVAGNIISFDETSQEYIFAKEMENASQVKNEEYDVSQMSISIDNLSINISINIDETSKIDIIAKKIFELKEILEKGMIPE